MSELTTFFSQYGVEPFLESTSLLVAVLDTHGGLVFCNQAFTARKDILPTATHVRQLVSPASALLFDKLLSTALEQRTRTRGGLEFAGEVRNDNFMCLFIPMPERRILFIAEQVTLASALEAVTAELQRTKRILTARETELRAVIAQAEEIAHTDALTFLPNRRQIMADLQREVVFSDRYGTPLSISLLDIDHFKNINDTFGHLAGDEVLRSIGSELREHIRYPDTIGRYGGEEFLIVLPHSTLQAAGEQAERLCRHMRSFIVRPPPKKISITISMGIAQYRVHREDWAGFLNRADAALYVAKNSGRDRWAISNGEA